ncbi:hypothetical protein GCM10028791_21420 [Echinicola sediminis]
MKCVNWPLGLVGTVGCAEGWSEFAIPTLNGGDKEVKWIGDGRSSGLQIQNSRVVLPKEREKDVVNMLGWSLEEKLECSK